MKKIFALDFVEINSDAPIKTLKSFQLKNDKNKKKKKQNIVF